MAFIDADSLTSLEEAFEKLGYGGLVTVLVDAGLTSMATLLALPTEALSGHRGINQTSISLIDVALERNGLKRRPPNEDISSYLKRQYGQAADAPVGVLQIQIVRTRRENNAILAPLELVEHLEKAHGFHRSIRGLLELEYEELKYAATMSDWQVEDLDQDLFNLRLRLMYLNLDFGVMSTTPDALKQ